MNRIMQFIYSKLTKFYTPVRWAYPSTGSGRTALGALLSGSRCNYFKPFVFCFVALSSAFAHGAPYQELFLRANKLYKERAYEKALQAYTSMPDKSSAVWYNSGNCLYHLGKYTDALVAFKRAQRGASRVQRKAIDQNIERTFEALGISRASVPYTQQIYAYFSRALATVPLLFLQLLFLFFLYGAFLCMRRRYGVKKSAHVTIVVCLISFTVLCGMALAVKYHDTWYAHGIVIQKQGSIFVGPDKKYDVSGAVALADELTILEKRAEWYKVKKGNLSGWVPAEIVAEID